MKSHSASHAIQSGRKMSVRLVALALTAFFTASQVPAQGPMDRDNAGQTQSANVQMTADNQASPSAAEPAEATEVPAPVPADEQAALVKPSSASMFSLAIPADSAQNIQSTPSTNNNKGIQRPGMLVMGIAGIPLIVLGAMLASLSVTKNAGLKDGMAAGFLAGGGAMSGFGFYYAFHKKNQ
jgi:hypothetical protein